MKVCNHRYIRNVQKDCSLAAILDFEKLCNFGWKTFLAGKHFRAQISGTIDRLILIFGMMIALYPGLMHMFSEF